MPSNILTHFILLPELELKKLAYNKSGNYFHVVKTNTFEVCPKCASKSKSIYDTRIVKIRDVPLRNRHICLVINKRRFWCKNCKKPFTEPIPGINKYKRTTQRYRKAILNACEKYTDLKQVRKDFKCSNDFIYKVLYEQLELNRRKKLYAWPKTIGIDEHSFKKNKFGRRDFVTVVTDMKGKRLMEVVNGKTSADLLEGLKHIPERTNVKNIAMDMCRPYKNFIKIFFPNAQITADKFHVLRLIHPAINYHRKQITGDARNNPISKLLLKDSRKIEYFKKHIIYKWLDQHPVIKELYFFKEAIYKLYRTKGYNKARKAFIELLDRMALSNIKEIQTLRKTLYDWRNEILNYFKTKITNAITEGFNNKAKLVKRRAYGYKSFKNYRLRLLNACS
jgi:transposase